MWVLFFLKLEFVFSFIGVLLVEIDFGGFNLSRSKNFFLRISENGWLFDFLVKIVYII